MPDDFIDPLDVIAGLRAEVRRHDEALYAGRIRLQKTLQRQRRAEQGQTLPAADRNREVASLRAQTARLNARLAQLREQVRTLARELGRISEDHAILAELQQRHAAAQQRADALRDEIATLQHGDPPPGNDIERLQRELAATLAAQAKLAEEVHAAEARKREQAAREESLRERLAMLQREMERLRTELAAVQGRVIDQQRPAFDDTDALNESVSTLEAATERSRAAGVHAKEALGSAIKGLYARDPHPRAALARFDDNTPFLLFPLRIETIFAPAALGGTELRVRVYPDDIAVQTHEPVLTEREVDAGRLYWVELLVAAHLRSERSRRQAAAWRYIVDLFGGQRGAWVVRQTRPTDWDTLAATGPAQSLVDLLRTADATLLPTLAAMSPAPAVRAAFNQAVSNKDGDALIRIVEAQAWGEGVNAAVRSRITGFPAADLTKTDAWSRAPRTTVLPDRLVLLLYGTEGASPREVTGQPIADTVFLGPDPLAPEDTLVMKDGARTLGGACDWMADFDLAVAQGLAFRVPVSAQETSSGFARVMVLGLKLSVGATDGAAMLEGLIANHQFSPKGFSLVPQGTPTNNTDRDGTGYSDNDPYDDLAFFTEVDPPAFDPLAADPLKSQTDGRMLADALGLAYPALQSVQRANQTDILEARAMNIALFPSTLGYWLKHWMAPVVTPDAARLTRSFFIEHVTGRGPLPAIRVGNQPYGVLVTSDMTRWRYPAPEGNEAVRRLFDDETRFLEGLRAVLLELQTRWDAVVDSLPHVGKPGSDASKVLMSVLGLHPTSVQFFQRVGFGAEYLSTLDRFKGRGSYANELASLLRSMPATLRNHLGSLGIDTDLGAVSKTLAMQVLWQHYVSHLDVPNLVEGNPPSEDTPLVFNYIDWLARAQNTSQIVDETFTAAKPAALLYLLLRNALLLQLNHGSYAWLKERSTFEASLERSLLATTLPGVSGSTPSLSRFEVMAVSVEAVDPDHPAPATRVADWIWRGPAPAEPEAAFVKTMRAALGHLASAPTARLERALVEHLDCCQYRLDAWQTGLFAQRLQAQRRGSDARPTGIYLGAYGFVEHVVPSPKTFLHPQDLPPSLRPTDDGPLLEEDTVGRARQRGGYMHGPSFNHAAAGALLRNAYLSHASSAQADMMSVNLSSQRVRRAQFVLEGMRNGQPIEALLGYQFERGLHDVTSDSAARGDVPVLELNQFLEPYRQAFPFESREIPQAGSGPATESVAPSSVVNGLKLSTATLSSADGFGLATVLTASLVPNAAQGAAVLSVREGLLDTLDAVKDLLMAENAYQLVQGNLDRVAAVSLAQKDARIPPSLEVLDTPRGTQFTFTNRVTLHFDDLDPTAPSSRPWPTPVAGLTPRAFAEPGLNRWLASVLGTAPDQVECTVYRVDVADPDRRLDAHAVTLRDLGLQPIDFVSLAGINAPSAEGATELEARVAWQYRRAQGISLADVVRIDFDKPTISGALTFGALLPLARRLRALLGECRALGAQDFLPAAGGKATAVVVDKSNPAGHDVADLRARVQSTFDALAALADALDGPAAPLVDMTLRHDAAQPGDDEVFSGRLGDAMTRLEQAGVDFADSTAVAVTFPASSAEVLAATLRDVALFGMADAFVPESDLASSKARIAVLARAHRVARRLRRLPARDGMLDLASALIAEATPDRSVADQVASFLQAGQALFSGSMKFLPAFACSNEVDIATADAARPQLLAHASSSAPGLSASGVVDEWLQGLARVRPRLHAWEVVRTLADALGDQTLDMKPVQLPHRDKDSWLAVEFPEHDPLDPTRPFGISRDTLSIAAHGDTAFKTGVPQRGLLLDEWTEEIPSTSENTGISFRFNQPNAVPPQALLLAVTPEQTGSWAWDDLVGTLNDTLARARRRAVEPSQLEDQGAAWNAMAPALVSEFSTLDKADVSLDLARVARFSAIENFYSADT